ncbi:MAG: NHLP leader peptide family RiPP precursor [Chloroflexota bacterium]
MDILNKIGPKLASTSKNERMKTGDLSGGLSGGLSGTELGLKEVIINDKAEADQALDIPLRKGSHAHTNGSVPTPLQTQHPADVLSSLDNEHGVAVVSQQTPVAEAVRPRIELLSTVIARTWTDPTFRARLLLDPRATLTDELGYELPAEMDIEILQEATDKLYIVVPPDPTELELSTDVLEEIAGGRRRSDTLTETEATGTSTSSRTRRSSSSTDDVASSTDTRRRSSRSSA